jgi:hypothetical protein
VSEIFKVLAAGVSQRFEVHAGVKMSFLKYSKKEIKQTRNKQTVAQG